MEKFNKILMLFLVLSVLCAEAALSIGLQGQALRVDTVYVPGTTESYSYTVGGPPGQGGMTIFSEGDLADWLHPSVEFIASGSENFDFTVDFIMTENPMPPSGGRSGRVCVMEAPPESEAMVVALTKSCAVFEARVLYEGIYPVLSVKIEEGTEFVNFSVTVRNDGTEDIEEALGSIEIINAVDESILETVVLSGGAAIASTNSISMEGDLDITSYTPGTYTAKVVILSDTEIMESWKNFSVGSEEVSLVDYTSSIELNGIQKVVINAKNEWAEAQDVLVTLSLGSESVNAQTQTLDAWEVGMFELFLDTSSFDLGEKTGKIIFNFGDDFSSEEEIIVTFTEGSADSSDSKGDSGSSGMSIWLIVGGVVLLILILVGLVLFIKSRSEEEDEDDF